MPFKQISKPIDFYHRQYDRQSSHYYLLLVKVVATKRWVCKRERNRKKTVAVKTSVTQFFAPERKRKQCQVTFEKYALLDPDVCINENVSKRHVRVSHLCVCGKVSVTVVKVI